jgi:YVTN family beta-propeller protein
LAGFDGPEAVIALSQGAAKLIEFRVLGSLQAVERDRQLALGSPRQRALLALLLIHLGEPVSSDRLVDELWGGAAPVSAVKIVQGYVSNLRKVLGEGLLVTSGRGYVLQAQEGETDAGRFAQLVAEGRGALADDDPRTAASRLRDALGLWRGPAFADFAYESFAQPEIARLDESRFAALEACIDAELAFGEHVKLVPELELLVREQPLREHFVGQLMTALYRCARQAEALECYRGARRRLVEELGLEPGRELQDLERRILAHDPALSLPGRTPLRRRRQPARANAYSGPLLVLGGLLLLAAIVAVATSLGGSGASVVRVAANTLAEIDGRSDRVIGQAPVGARPGAVAFGSGSLWVANLDDQTISRIDPRTLRTVRTIAVQRSPTSLATTSDGVWVVESDVDRPFQTTPSSVLVGRVDPEFDTIDETARIDNVVPNGPASVAALGDSVWVAPSSGLLTRLDASTAGVKQQLDPNASPGGIALGDGAVWLTDTEADDVVRVDPTGVLTPIPVGNAPTAIAVGGGGVWVVDAFDDAVVRIDPGTRSVTANIAVGSSPSAVAYGAGSVWVTNGGDGTVTRIDPQTDRVVSTIAVGGSPQGLTVADGKVWVAVDARPVASPGAGAGGTLRVLSSFDVDYVDPALAESPLSQQLVYETCAQLLTYPDRGGPAGSQLTPEVAASLPVRSADGRTYTFRIRPGFRFSPPSNQRVTAETFKETIERTLNPRMQSPSAEYLDDVVGARAYTAGRAEHISGVTADGNVLTIRLLAPASDFLSRIAQLAFCAVPPGTPVSRDGVRAIPSAGPYYVSSYTPGQGVVLVRNPNYHGSRPRYFDRIELAVGISARRAADEIEAGTADYTSIGVDSYPTNTGVALSAQLAARYGRGSPAAAHGEQQYFVNPSDQLDFFFLNTHRPLFSSLHMRQAVNFAIDRRALARLGDFFEPLPETPTDHYLPPPMPGFRQQSVYPLTPDLRRARELARGEEGRTAVLYTCEAYPCPEQAQIVKTDLAAIGLRVHVETFPSSKMFALEATPGAPFDLAWDGWIPDYLDPAAMLNPLLEDPSDGPTFEDPAYKRRLAAADRLSGPRRYLAYGKLDVDLARDAAPLAAFGNLPSYDFFSARIGCQAYGVYGIDLGGLCLRRRPR